MKSLHDFYVKFVSIIISGLVTTSLIFPISSKLVFAQENVSKNDVTVVQPHDKDRDLPVITITAPRRKDIEVFDGIDYPIDNPKQMVPNRTYNLDYLLFLP